jgi:hypothetical protein
VADSVRSVHYISAEAALKIIESKRVWMRNTVCMTDYREVQHGFSILHKFFSDKSKEEEFYAPEGHEKNRKKGSKARVI